jgi:hypothetical protein
MTGWAIPFLALRLMNARRRDPDSFLDDNGLFVFVVLVNLPGILGM